jgi:hypothetical protein
VRSGFASAAILVGNGEQDDQIGSQLHRIDPYLAVGGRIQKQECEAVAGFDAVGLKLLIRNYSTSSLLKNHR